VGESDLTLGGRLFAALAACQTRKPAWLSGDWRSWLMPTVTRKPRCLRKKLAGGRSRLRLTEHGRKFLAAWDAFMTEHGHHCRGELELFNARWSETPDYILGLVRGYLRSLGQSDPLEISAAGEERERLTSNAARG